MKRARKPAPQRRLLTLITGFDPRSVWAEMPIMLVSETNVREHWSKRHRRRKAQRSLANHVACAYLPSRLPITIRVTRIAPRPLDGHDNLRSSAKAIVDGLADWLGVKDDDPRITWEYAQKRGEPRTYGVRVDVLADGGF